MTASSARVPARRWQVLDATALKLLAMALMTADHIHQMFAPAGAPLWLTILGRPVFPLFLFAANTSEAREDTSDATSLE